MTANAKLVSIGLLVIIALLLSLLLSAQSGTPDSQPKNPCFEFEDRQERIIIEVGGRLLGDLHDFPLLADPKVQSVYLVAHGVTNVGDISQFRVNAAYVHQTVRELNQGYCWDAKDGGVLSILRQLQDAFKDWK